MVVLAGCAKEESALVPVAEVAPAAQQADAPIAIQAQKVPLIPQRADPYIHRTESGQYYFIATSPGFDQIELRTATSLKGLSDAPAKVLWRKHATGIMGANIWAPEIHYFNNSWYIYFAAGDAEKGSHIRMYVLANDSADPMEGEWRELGRVTTARDSFSLDATSFEHKGQRYLLWAQKDPEETMNSALYLAKLITPTQVGEQEVELSRPELGWEILGYKVNEGAAVIVRNGKVFVTYSASATDDRYAMGLLWADENADLLDKNSWHKAQQPVFFTNDKLHRYGPGHNSFTLAEDGKTDVLVYHARQTVQLAGSPLSDPNRHTYIRTLKWLPSGFPDFGQDSDDDLPQ